MVQDYEHDMDNIESPQESVHGWPFGSLMNGDRLHDVTWQPASGFVCIERTVTQVWKDYICDKNTFY